MVASAASPAFPLLPAHAHRRSCPNSIACSLPCGRAGRLSGYIGPRLERLEQYARSKALASRCRPRHRSLLDSIATAEGFHAGQVRPGLPQPVLDPAREGRESAWPAFHDPYQPPV